MLPSVPQNSTPPISTDETDQQWANENRPVLSRIIELFLSTGKWSSADDIQRFIDRQTKMGEITVFNVQEVFQNMPIFPGEMYYPQMRLQEVRMPLRFFIYFECADDLLVICNLLVKRAVEIYFSDIEPVTLTNTDPNIQTLASSTSNEIVLRAVELLVNDYPSPISGGGWGNDQWTLGINGSMARQFQQIDTIEDYFARQRQIRKENYERSQPLRNPNIVSPLNSEEIPLSTSTPQKTIFVIMPFNLDWSQGIYEFIKRSIETVEGYIIEVFRADEIDKSEPISDQIIQSIRNCDAIIADITESNPNVMWELGYACALDKACVVMNQNVANSPFDLSEIKQMQYRSAPTEDDEKKLASFVKNALDSKNANEAS